MVHFYIPALSIPVFAFAVTTVAAIPLEKRISQTISDSTTAWVSACNAAGGGSQCNTISQQAFTTLLAAGGNCDQQNAADSMISLAKSLASSSQTTEMIRLSQLFAQQPRNAPDSLQVPYCQSAPNNTELTGFFHCQFAGSNFQEFSGDQTGNVPLGLKSVTPPGSCPAKPDEPVPDGVQLNTLVTDPGVPSTGGSDDASPVTSSVASPSAVPTTGVPSTGGDDASPVTSSITSPSAVPTNTSSTAGAGDAAKPFTLQNGEDAQSLNAKFTTLTADSACTSGEDACINGGFAQCVDGKFSISECAAGTQCFALPLVNSAGTSVTCSTEADATARIAATGATGGITGA